MLHSVGQVVSNGKPEAKQGNSHKKAQETQKYLVNLVPFCGQIPSYFCGAGGGIQYATSCAAV